MSYCLRAVRLLCPSIPTNPPVLVRRINDRKGIIKIGDDAFTVPCRRGDTPDPYISSVSIRIRDDADGVAHVVFPGGYSDVVAIDDLMRASLEAVHWYHRKK